MLPFAIMSAQILRWGVRSAPIGEGRVLEWAAWGCVPFIILAVLKRRHGISNGKSAALGQPVDATAGGLPMLSWSQKVGTGESVGQRQDRFEIVGFIVIFSVALYLGYHYGRWEGLFAGALLGGFFGGTIFRHRSCPRAWCTGRSWTELVDWLGPRHSGKSAESLARTAVAVW